MSAPVADPHHAKVSPIADGRIVVTDGAAVRYLHGDGAVDAKRGTAGTRATTASIAVAVEPTTGRVAVLRYVDPTSNVGLELDLYDPRGRRVASRVIRSAYDRFGTDSAAVVFGSGGGVLVAIGRTQASSDPAAAEESIDPTSQATLDYVADVQRYDATLARDLTFGIQGTRTIAYMTGASVERSESGSVLNLYVDAAGRSYLHTENLFYDVHLNGTESHRVTRLTASGAVDTSYGGFGTGTFINFSSNIGTGGAARQSSSHLLDLSVAPNGRLFELSVLVTNYDAGVYYDTRQYGPDGENGTGTGFDGTLFGGAGPLPTGALAVAADGTVNVAMNANGNVARIARLRISPDGLNIYGRTFLNTAISQPAEGLAFDASGRLLLSGAVDSDAPSFALMAIEGEAASPASIPAGAARLLADGALFVRGTGRPDAIVVRTRHGQTVVYR